MQHPPLEIDWKTAKTFLDLLGKNGDARFRAFPHKHTPVEIKKKLKARSIAGEGSGVQVLQAQNAGLGIYLVINKGGDTKASIKLCIAYFAEFDGESEDIQLQRVADSGLPEASIINRTQGGSLHFYWLLSEPVANTALWQGDMKRLAAYLKSDPSINDPSRVMRLPGCYYMDGNQQPVGLVETIHISDCRYKREDIVNCIPPDPTPFLEKPKTTSPKKTKKTRTSERALSQLKQVPARTPGEGSRSQYLDLLWALSSIIGPDAAGREMAQHSPSWAAEEDLVAKAKEANGELQDGTFFELTRKHWNISDPNSQEPAAEPSGAAQGGSDTYDDEDEDELTEDDLELQREAMDRYRKAQDATIDLKEVFGPIWGQLLIDRAAAFPCDPVMLLLPMLCFMASIIGTRASIKVKGGWLEPFIIYGLIAQAASSLKSPAAGVFLRVLAKLQSESAQAYKKLITTHKQKEKRWKAECAQITTAAKKSGESPDYPEPPEPPMPARHYYIETITIERLAEIHAQNNVPGLLAYHDELSDWFASLDKRNGQSDRPKWLKLWTGQALKHDTRTSLSAFAERTAVSTCGFIQPDKLAALHAAEYDSDFDTSGDGLWARFLPVIPKNIPFTFNDLEVDITDELMALANSLDSLPRDLVLNIHASAINDVFKPKWEAWSEMESQTSPSRQAFIGKLRGYSVRIAGLLHLLNDSSGIDLTIAQPTAMTAVKLCDFFLAQFDQLAPQVTAHGEVSGPVAKFLSKVKEKGLQEVRARDVQTWKLLGRKAKAKNYIKFLQQLADQGIGEVVRVHNQGSKNGSWLWKAPIASKTVDVDTVAPNVDTQVSTAKPTDTTDVSAIDW